MKHKPNWIIRKQLKMLTPEKAKARIEEAVMECAWHRAFADQRVKDYVDRERVKK